MKKLRITDADGEIYEVEEVEETPVEETPAEEVSDAEGETLTSDEIADIKALLPQLKELLKKEVSDEETDEEVEEEVEEEEVVDSCKDEDEEEMISDSAASVRKQTNDSKIVDNETSIVEAWKKRYEDALKGGRK